MVLDVAAIKARRDWRTGRDLSPVELRLDDECLAQHYAEDVTLLLDEVERLRGGIRDAWEAAVRGDIYDSSALFRIHQLLVGEGGERD